jgi:hypothetical protein
MLVMSLVLLLGFTSAAVCVGNTVVGGTIYQNTITNPVAGASVTVTCNGNTKTDTSGANGAYSVVFSCYECHYNDAVVVDAAKNPLTGESKGTVSMTYPGLNLDVGIVNVPMVPEFGLIAGLTTVLGALGVFFVVRRK